MAEVAKSGTPSMSTQTPSPENRRTGHVAAEAIAAGDCCYIAADNKVYRSIGTAVNAAAQVDGWCAIDCQVGEAITLVHDMNFYYGSSLTPGAKLYVSATVPGGLADAATTGGTKWVAKVYDPTRIYVRMSDY